MKERGRRAGHVTQEEVSRRAGVSRSVVSYVLNGGPRPVSDTARRRVLDAIRELDYRPNKHAQLLIQQKWGSVASRQIGVVLGSGAMFERPFYGEILRGLHDAAHAAHGHVRFIRLFSALEDPALLNQLVHRHEVSGIVLLGLGPARGGGGGETLLGRIRERVDNLVCVDWQHDGLHSVGFDRRAAARDVANHLLDLGHRRIAFVGHRDEREAGFADALGRRGLVPHAVADADDAPAGFAAVRPLLGDPPRDLAILAGSDEVAFGILRALRVAGLRVPADVSVASIDDIGLAAYASPPLTTVDVPKSELGAQAVRTLLDPGSGASRTIVLPTRLVVRESCGARSEGRVHTR